MVAIAPPQVVNGAPRAPLPHGLFSVLGFRGDGERWENGVIFEGVTCEPAGGIGAPDCDPEVDVIGLPKDLESDGVPVGEASPFVVYGHHTCSPIGNSFARAQELANQHLQVREEARVEQALWTGDLGNVPNFSGANGYAAPVNLGTLSPWRAVSLLEQELAARYGSLGVIHMSRQIASRLTKEGDLVRQGGRLFTALGTPIVAGTGYASDRIVGTPALFGYRGEVFSSSNRPGDLLDRSNNDLYAVAEREYLVGFDECALLEVTVTDDNGGGDVGVGVQNAIDNGDGTFSLVLTDGSTTDPIALIPGEDGAAATVAVGDVATGAAGSAVTVVNSGTSSAAVLDFSIPQGQPGADGDDGADGVVQSIVAGDGVAVDPTDPANPIISTTTP